ncbi:MAG: site-2 protease family protein [Christensenellaceae bacterium]
MNYLQVILELVASFLAVLIVLTMHEWAHSFVAYKCGDPTPKMRGRLSLNPLRHFDLIGLIAFTLTGFGWAKPVPINPYNFKHYRSGLAWTSLAGVLMNYLLAFFIGAPLMVLAQTYLPRWLGADNALVFLLISFTNAFYVYNISFCAFNLLPLPPLDGYNLIRSLQKREGKVMGFLRRYGQYILLGLVIWSYLCSRLTFLSALNVLGYLLWFARNILAYPISSFWNWIFSLIF